MRYLNWLALLAIFFLLGCTASSATPTPGVDVVYGPTAISSGGSYIFQSVATTTPTPPDGWLDIVATPTPGDLASCIRTLSDLESGSTGTFMLLGATITAQKVQVGNILEFSDTYRMKVDQYGQPYILVDEGKTSEELCEALITEVRLWLAAIAANPNNPANQAHAWLSAER